MWYERKKNIYVNSLNPHVTYIPFHFRELFSCNDCSEIECLHRKEAITIHSNNNICRISHNFVTSVVKMTSCLIAHIETQITRKNTDAA